MFESNKTSVDRSALLTSQNAVVLSGSLAAETPGSNHLLSSSTLPSAVVEQVTLDSERVISVVRDDLLPGGTKQRGLLGALLEFAAQGKTEFVYASPFCGYAQLALSHLCRELGFKCVLYCERDPSMIGLQPHEYTRRAESWGASVHLCSSLAEASQLAKSHEIGRKQAVTIPLGFDCEEFYQHYRSALQREWMKITAALREPPQTLWVCVGSGTLMRSFRAVLKNSATRVCGVNVHVLPGDDLRIVNLGASDVRSANLQFCEATEANLGFPSNRFYDAKVIPFLKLEAQDGDLFWNVGR